MIRRIFFLLTLFALLLSGIPATAQQSSAWLANLYDQNTGIVTRMAPDGTTIDTYQLLLPEGYNTFGYEIAATDTHIAYTVFQLDGYTDENPAAAVVIFDIETNGISGVYSLDDRIRMEGINAAASSLTFINDGEAVVTGYHFGDGDSFETAIVVLTLDGSLMRSLDGPIIEELTQGAGAFYVSIFGDVDGSVLLRLDPIFVHDERPAYIVQWSPMIEAYQVQEVVVELNGDMMAASNTAITPAFDGRYTAIERPFSEGVDMPQFNVVNLIQLQQRTESMLYHAADAEIITAKYVSGGELVLITLDNRAGGIPFARLINLEGDVLNDFEATQALYNPVLTPDGWIGNEGTFLNFTTAGSQGVENVVVVTPENPVSDIAISR